MYHMNMFNQTQWWKKYLSKELLLNIINILVHGIINLLYISYTYVYTFISIYLSIYLSIYISIYLSIYLYIYIYSIINLVTHYFHFSFLFCWVFCCFLFSFGLFKTLRNKIRAVLYWALLWQYCVKFERLVVAGSQYGRKKLDLLIFDIISLLIILDF